MTIVLRCDTDICIFGSLFNNLSMPAWCLYSRGTGRRI